MTRRARPHPLDERIPFYANRTLDLFTHLRVALHLMCSRAARKDLAFCRLLCAEIPIADSPQPSEDEWGEVWNRIVPQISPIRQIGSSGAAGRRRRVAPLPARARRAGSWSVRGAASSRTAAALVVAMLGASAGLYWPSVHPGDETGSYRLAGERRITVEFRAGATAEQIRDLLAGLQLTVVDGPTDVGVYQLRLTDPDAGSAAIERAIRALRTDEIVSHASAQ